MEVGCTTIDVRSRRTRIVGKNKGSVYCYQQTLYRISFPSITYSLFFISSSHNLIIITSSFPMLPTRFLARWYVPPVMERSKFSLDCSNIPQTEYKHKWYMNDLRLGSHSPYPNQCFCVP